MTRHETYTEAVLDIQTTNGQRLEQLRDGFATSLGIASSARRRALGRREEGDTLRGLRGNVGPSHD